MFLMNRRVGLAVGALMVGLLSGCGDGNARIGAPTQGNVEGFAFTASPDIILRNDPTPPAGGAALAGAEVTVAGAARATTTDSRGHFLLKGVSAGLHRLRITPPAPTGALPLEIPITVLGQATIQVGQTPISRAQAIDRVKGALTGSVDPEAVQILAPQHPLPAGTTVVPALGNDQAQQDPALAYQVPKPQWLVFVDEFPGQRFQHPVQFFFVDAVTGQVNSREATSWPGINGLNFYPNPDVNQTSPDLVQTGDPEAVPTRSQSSAAIRSALASLPATRDHVPGCTDGKIYALFIQGDARSDFAADFDNMRFGFFGPGGLPGTLVISEFRPPEQGIALSKTQVTDKFKLICQQAQECDAIFIYITAHGSRTGAMYLQRAADGTPIDDAYIFPFADLDTSDCKACHVIIIMDACFSGQAMVDIAVRTPPHPGQKRIVMASSSSTETSGGITGGDNPGGVFTNAFRASFSEFSQAHGGVQQAHLKEIFDGAVTRIPPEKQHPQVAQQWDGKPCGAEETPLVSVTPPAVTATHTVGETPCPQELAFLSLKNLSTGTISYQATVDSSVFTLANASNSISLGNTAQLDVGFNCSQLPPLTGTITLKATGPGETSQELTIPITLHRGP